MKNKVKANHKGISQLKYEEASSDLNSRPLVSKTSDLNPELWRLICYSILLFTLRPSPGILEYSFHGFPIENTIRSPQNQSKSDLKSQLLMRDSLKTCAMRAHASLKLVNRLTIHSLMSSNTKCNIWHQM